MNNNARLVFCNIDEHGFIEIYQGINIIPYKPFQYFFMVDKDKEIPMGVTLAELEQWQNEYSASLNTGV